MPKKESSDSHHVKLFEVIRISMAFLFLHQISSLKMVNLSYWGFFSIR